MESDENRAQALLGALSELAARIQSARTVDTVLDVASRGLRALGLNLIALEVYGESLRVRHALPETMPRLREMLGRSYRGLELPLLDGSSVARALASRRAQFSPELVKEMADIVERMGLERSAVEPIIRAAGYGRGVVAPVEVRGRPWSVLVVASDALEERDVPALALFAAHVGSAVEVAEAIERLEQRNAALAGIYAAAEGMPDPEVLAPQLLEVVALATESDMAAMWFIDAERNELVLAAAHGAPPEWCEANPRVSLSDERPIARVVRDGRRLAGSTSSWPGPMQAELERAGVLELAALPLRFAGRTAGALKLGRKRTHPYRTDELEWAEIVAAQVAVQVEKARLYDESRRRVRQLSLMLELTRIATEVHDVASCVDRALKTLVESLAVDVAFLHVVSEGRLVRIGARHAEGVVTSPEEDERFGTIPIDERTVTGRAALSMRIEHATCDDVREPKEPARKKAVRSVVAAPLVSGGALVGTLTCARSAERALSAEERRLIESCAAQLAAMLEHARLFEEEHRRVQDLSLINELGALIAQHLELDKVLDVGVRNLSRICGVPNVFLMLLDRAGEKLVTVAANVEGCLPLEIRVDQASAAAAALRAESPVVIDDPVNDPRASTSLAVRFGHKALLAVPLRSRGRPLGVLVLGETREGRRFALGDVDRAVAVSNQLASAIANAQLFDDLRRSYDELAKAQEKVVRSERLAALGELAGAMAHEVRNPLGVIYNSLVSLRKLLQPTGDAAMLISILGEEAERLNRIVAELLDFARPYEIQLRPVYLDRLVSSAIESAKQAVPSSQVRVTAQVSPQHPPLMLDGHMLRQAVMNLVTNAIQAMPRGGEVRVAADVEEHPGRSLVRIEVTDQGVGISPQVQSRMFEPFFTTKATGTGLGLAVVKRIIDAHHGEIEVRTAAGLGTTFTLRVPAEEVQ